MAGTDFIASARGTTISVDSHSFVITAAETNQIYTPPTGRSGGKVGSVVVWGTDAGTTCVLDLYDATSNTNQKWKWVTADGKGVFAIQMPMQNGIRVVTSGTLPASGGFTVMWDK